MKRLPVFQKPKLEGVSKFNGKAHIDKMYKGEWAQYSSEFLALNTKCYSCGQKSEATDHIKVHLGDFELFYDRENHIPLCHKCHNYITGKFDRKIPQDLVGKMRWIGANRMRNGLTFSVKILPFVFQSLTQYRLNLLSNK